MPVLVTADWHLTDNARDRYRFKALEFILDLVAKRHVERFIMLGDLTHNKNYHSDVLTNDVVGYLHEFARLCPVYILQGNHDYIEADTAFFQFVRFIRDVHWVWKPCIIPITGLGDCCFLPHTRDHKKDWIDISSVWGKSNLIFAHNAFEGAVAESGKRLSGIPLNVFPNIQVISGDIHEPQTLGDDRLIYVGSPFTQKFGDNFEPRVLLIDNGEVQSISVPGPQKRLFDIMHVSQLKNLKYNKDDMIKVRYHLHADERDTWSETKKQIQEFFGGNAQIQPVLEQVELPQQRTTLTNKDDKQLVRNFGEQQRASPGTMVTGYELLTAV